MAKKTRKITQITTVELTFINNKELTEEQIAKILEAVDADKVDIIKVKTFDPN